MRHIILAVSAAVVVAGTTPVSAQLYWDDPPGSAYQNRGLLEDLGEEPRFPYRLGSPYGAYGAYAGPYGAYAGPYNAYAYVGPGPRYRYYGNGYRWRR